jgi:hypothetical protein
MRTAIFYAITLAVSIPTGIGLRSPFHVMVAQWGLPNFTALAGAVACAAVLGLSLQSMAIKWGWIHQRRR